MSIHTLELVSLVVQIFKIFDCVIQVIGINMYLCFVTLVSKSKYTNVMYRVQGSNATKQAYFGDESAKLNVKCKCIKSSGDSSTLSHTD